MGKKKLVQIITWYGSYILCVVDAQPRKSTFYCPLCAIRIIGSPAVPTRALCSDRPNLHSFLDLCPRQRSCGSALSGNAGGELIDKLILEVRNPDEIICMQQKVLHLSLVPLFMVPLITQGFGHIFPGRFSCFSQYSGFIGFPVPNC